MAFLKKFNIKKNCVGNHQAMNILSNFDSRKTEYREMIGSSVQDFGSFYQKPLEPIFTKDVRQPLWVQVNLILERNWSLSRFWLKAEGQFKSLEALADAKRALKKHGDTYYLDCQK